MCIHESFMVRQWNAQAFPSNNWEETWGFIWTTVELHYEHLISGVKNALPSNRNSEGKTDVSANASDTEDDTVVGVSVFMVFINDAQSHRYETCNSFVKYMQLRGTDERLDSQPQAQITHVHMHMHVRRSPHALWKAVCRPVSDSDITRATGTLNNASSFLMCPLELCCFVSVWRHGATKATIVNLQILGSVDDREG